MNNLFSIFDPVTQSPYLSLNWCSGLLVVMLPPVFWVNKSMLQNIFKLVFKGLSYELSSVLGKTGSGKMFLVSFFSLILLINSGGMLPFVFTSTSHLSITLALALPCWAGYFFAYTFQNPSKALAHLVPSGTPLFLVPFMVIIELVSNLIRPLTLAVRLAANMVAGHLLLSLLSGPIVSSSWPVASVLMSALVVLICLELSVCLIQAYVYVTLSSLYMAEVASY